jgi:hypothetical protein
MDDYRKKQKQTCADGSSKQSGKYGCSCCRVYGRNIKKQKEYGRKIARVRLNREDEEIFSGDDVIPSQGEPALSDILADICDQSTAGEES